MKGSKEKGPGDKEEAEVGTEIEAVEEERVL